MIKRYIHLLPITILFLVGYGLIINGAFFTPETFENNKSDINFFRFLFLAISFLMSVLIAAIGTMLQDNN